MPEEMKHRIRLLTTPGYTCGDKCVCVGLIYATLSFEQKTLLLKEIQNIPSSKGGDNVIPQNLLHNFALNVQRRDEGWFEPLLHIAQAAEHGIPPLTLSQAIFDMLICESKADEQK